MFSLAFTGDAGFIGPIAGELQRRFPQATLYDRSSAVSRRRTDEATFGAAGLLQPQDLGFALRVARDLAAPPPTDLVVDFRIPAAGGSEEITISSRNGSKRLTLQTPKSVIEFKLSARRVVAVIEALL